MQFSSVQFSKQKLCTLRKDSVQQDIQKHGFVTSSYQRRRSTDNLALVIVLGSMARADELVLGAVPRHDAAKVRADGVDPVGREGLVGLHDEVGRITLHIRGFSKLP